MTRSPIALVGLVVLVALVACTAATPTATFTNTPKPSSTAFIEPFPEGVAASPAGRIDPGPLGVSGTSTASCEGGWVTPVPGSAEWSEPIRVIRRRLQVGGEPVVGEMRLFVGPESPPSDKAYIGSIRRWYVELAYPGEPGAEGRFLVEERGFGAGLVAVAPIDTEGFRSPDWVGFQYDPSAPPERYPGLPGVWQGVPYDFVSGGEGLTIPGLPEVLTGCLDGS